MTRVPLNTSIRNSPFVHPLHPAPADRHKITHDFGDFLLAVSTRVLQRRPSDGSYQIRRRGNLLAIGVERLVRRQGISDEYLNDVRQQCKWQINRAQTASQLCALSVLFEAYMEEAYSPRVVTVDAFDRILMGMGYFVCRRLHHHFHEEFLARAIDEKIADPAALALTLRQRIEQWTDLIDHSHEDGYVHEVGARACEKRVVKPQFFDPGWLAGSLSGTVAQVAILAPPPVESPAMYYVALDNVAVGPVGAGELTNMVMTRSVGPDTPVCLVGARHWSSAASFTALTPLFTVLANPAIENDDSCLNNAR